MKLKKKSKSERKEKVVSTITSTKKELAELKTSYKNKDLKFDSKEIADAILKDKYFRSGLTK